MPTKHVITYHEVQAPITDLVTKFGGQPAWLGPPQLPLSRRYGTPMMFVCQIVVPPELLGAGGDRRMAYLLVTEDDEGGYVAETWGSDGGENALIVQPEGSWDGQSAPLNDGPSLYRLVQRGEEWVREPCEFAVELSAGNDRDAHAWDDVDPDDAHAWNTYFAALIEDKIGGVPAPNTNSVPPVSPGPSDWRFLLQLNTKDNEAGDLFFLNFASGGVGYAFLAANGRCGRFLWLREFASAHPHIPRLAAPSLAGKGRG